MNLTDAQKRLIREAQSRDDNRINFYGIPEKTQNKLRELGLFETVLSLSATEIADTKDAIHKDCSLLVGMLDTGLQLHVQRTGRSITNNINRLYATKNVLTEKGLLVQCD